MDTRALYNSENENNKNKRQTHKALVSFNEFFIRTLLIYIHRICTKTVFKEGI